MTQDYFETISGVVQGALAGDEAFTCSYAAEDSDFVRFNANQVRQAGAVSQRTLGLDLIQGRRHAKGTICLSGDVELDRPRLLQLVGELREKRAVLPEDPFLCYSTEVQSSTHEAPAELPAPDYAVDQIRAGGEGKDLVGIYASGGIQRGFANSFGQRNWFSTHNFNFDWSFYHTADKAVKEAYAGFQWDAEAFAKKVQGAAHKLEVIKHPGRSVEAKAHRVYLSPAALYDIVGLLSWGGFGLEAHKTKQTCLLKMVEEGRTLNPAVTISENTAEGVAPNFQEAGFIRPARVPLIEAGVYKECLVSPRSAKRFDVPTNGASAHESPESIDVAAGSLSEDEVLSTLGTGVYVGNVWYLNYSDVPSCRATGMTRFATFWVEDGEIVAPLKEVMRFDETIYNMLGERLVGLTDQRDLVLDPSTYGGRETTSGRVPGAVVDGFQFTL